MEHPVRRLLALGATALVVALAVVGALPDPTGGTASFPPARPTRVLVLGDSVMKGAAGVYASKLPGREVVVDAEVNRSTGAGAEVIDRLGTDWDVVVVLLGHNDGGSPGAYQPAARRILDQLRGVRRVSWLTIHEVRPYYPAVNQFVAGLQDEYPNLRVGDWNAVAAAHPEGLSGDGLHLNGTGADLMSDLVAEQVEVAELEWLGDLQRLAAATSTTTAPPTTTTTAPPTTTSTSTSTTTTTEAPTTTTSAPACVQVLEEGERVTSCSSAPEQAVPADDAPTVAVAGGAVALVALGAGTWGWRRRRRRRSLEADTAG